MGSPPTLDDPFYFYFLYSSKHYVILDKFQKVFDTSKIQNNLTHNHWFSLDYATGDDVSSNLTLDKPFFVPLFLHHITSFEFLIILKQLSKIIGFFL